jgi:peptidoglycan/LPS O-acetylase OafA/YrhL
MESRQSTPLTSTPVHSRHISAEGGFRIPSPRTDSTTDAGPAGTGFRADIEGLRAVAVLLVVLGHAGVGLFAGGYVGVDVFFVISGFLITSLLMRELAETGRIRIAGFYARRAIRLLPASSLALAATLLGAWLWLSPVRFGEYARDALASAAYVINLRLAVVGTDYLAAAEPPSPLQHFWSLAVEEQFYLVWPLLILAVTWAGRRRGRLNVPAVAVALGVLTGASFLLSVTETGRSAPWAYFGPHTRAWELGLGAMVALAATRLRHLPAWLAAALTWVGLGAVAAAAVLYDDSTPFPGVAAAAPVVGAALVIVGGCRRPAYGAGLLLNRWPMQAVGRVSYGWYLWHWPFLLILPVALDLPDRVAVNLVLCAGALVVAVASLRLVEDPVRHRRSLRLVPARGIGLGLSLSSATAAAALLAAAVPPTVPTGDDGLDLRLTLGQAADPARLLADVIARDANRQSVPANLVPTPAQAKRDKPVSYGDGCHLSIAATRIPGACAYGDPAAATTVALFGDSHAAQWLPALDRLARERGWRLLSLTKSSCTAADVLLWENSLKRAYDECQSWREDAFQRIAAQEVDLVVVSSIFDDRRLAAPTADPELQWRAGWERTFGRLSRAGAAVTLIADTPYLSASAPDCVAQHASRISRCARATGPARPLPDRRAAIAGAAATAGVTVVDPTGWLCAAQCPVVLGNVLVYRDAHHLTTVFATTLAPLLGARLPGPGGG